MTERIERDSLGEIRVETDKKWGAQTQRSLQNFPIGEETMPREIILAFAHLKKACALVNGDLGELQKNEAAAIAEICDELLAGGYADQFPLKVWQTGSGTQTNMNLNEVIAHIAAERGVLLHPNDHVNRSQSSNDTFPTAMNLAAVVAIQERVLPALETMRTQLKNLEK